MSDTLNIKHVLELLEPYDPGLFPDDITERYGIPSAGIVNLSSNENPYPPPEGVIKAVVEALNSTNRYPDPSYRELKEAISKYVKLDAEWVAVGNGSSDMVDLICKTTLSPLDRVVIPVPTYALYMLASMVWEAGISYVETEDSDFTIKAARMQPLLEDAKLVFLGSPNNPTGVRVKEEELEMMLEAKHATFVLDEAYYEFSGKTAVDLLDEHENLIIIRSMSKYFCLAGLRVGYALSNPQIIEGLEKVRLPFNINSLAKTAAVHALQQMEYYKKIGQRIVSERENLRKELERVGLGPLPSEANFLMVRLPEGLDADEFAQKLAAQGVIVRSLKGLLGLTRKCFRVTVGTEDENRKFIQVCEDVLKSI